MVESLHRMYKLLTFSRLYYIINLTIILVYALGMEEIMKRVIYAADRGDALVGIYWYTDDHEVIGLAQPVDDGEIDGPYIQFKGPNHLSAWKQVVRDNFSTDEQEAIIARGFKSLYRGRCIYSTVTQTYTVTCSKDLVDDKEFRTKVKEYFQLTGVRVEFLPLNHYQYKLELTGNPAIDDMYFDN